MRQLDTFEIWPVLRKENTWADILSKLANTKPEGNNQSLIQETLIAEALLTLAIEVILNWMTPIIQYLQNGTRPKDPVELKRMAKEASYYTIIEGQLYRRGLSQPLLKCLNLDRISFILDEVHEVSCGHYLRGKALAIMVLQASYYWPSVTKDSIDYTKKCPNCQKHAHFHVAPVEELSTIMSPWLFSKWRIDHLGPFLFTSGRVKYLIVVIDYFTKWVEVEPLSTIMVAQAQKFIWRNIFTRFGIPDSMATDNWSQFIDQKLQGFLASYKVKYHFTSVEHLQANNQVQAANKVMLQGLKKRLYKAKRAWTNELDSVIWSYWTTLQSITGETPFKLTYGVVAMIPVVIEEPSPQVIF